MRGGGGRRVASFSARLHSPSWGLGMRKAREWGLGMRLGREYIYTPLILAVYANNIYMYNVRDVALL